MRKAVYLPVPMALLLITGVVFAEGMKGEIMEGKTKGRMKGHGMMDKGGMMGMCPKDSEAGSPESQRQTETQEHKSHH